MITIPSMPTQYRPLPQLKLDLEAHELRTLALALDRVVSPESYTVGLCVSVERMLYTITTYNVDVPRMYYKFGYAVGEGMNSPEEDTYHVYVASYLSDEWRYVISDKELAAIRDIWAKHIARSIYEQIGDCS